MFSIKRFISFIICAVLLLSGCTGSPDMPSFSFPDKSSRTSSSTQSEPDSVTESSRDISEPSSDTSEPASTAETSEPVSEANAPEVDSVVLSHDPINEKTIEVNGKTAVISGKTADSPVDHMSVFPREAAKFDLNSDKYGFTAEVDLTDLQTDFLTVTVTYEDGHYDEVELAVTQNGFEIWELSDVVENNGNVVKNAIEQPQNQVAEYIVKGGKPDDIRKVLEEIQALSDEICAGLDSDYDKLRAISRWVSANIYYDYPAYDRGVPDETLSLKYMLDRHSSVCGGYSNMTSALCAAQGIKCWNVHGGALPGGRTFLSSNNSEYHEWNFAEIDGRIIWIDSGWNSYCYLRRDGTYDDGGICYRYFDIGEEYFALNHKANYAEYRDYFAILR
ncbi:MAG: transglutaminase domain-containing protein [Ruminococcaceae bacterium]|nr:transglutaminase domain-containing protein [Oscillospiraceae bacterium]